MKKLLLISLLVGALPLSMMAQDDDLYFVPKKKSVEKVVEKPLQPATVTPIDVSVDQYNRHVKSSYEVIDGDTVQSDIIDFSGEKGVYPDSLSEDFELTKKLSRFDDYPLADNAAFWAGYQADRYDWGWHSPWYYSRYGWYDPWYSPWYYGYRGWYSYYPWYDPWYDPWYSPYYYGYYGWGYPYYHYPTYVVIGGGGRGHSHIGTGTIRRDGSTHGHYRGGAFSGNGHRSSSLRDRATRMSGGSTYSSGNRDRSGSGNFSGYRGGNTNTSSSRGNSSYSGSSRSNSSYSGGSFGGSRSSGGGFSGGGSRGGGGGGGSRMGGRR